MEFETQYSKKAIVSFLIGVAAVVNLFFNWGKLGHGYIAPPYAFFYVVACSILTVQALSEIKKRHLNGRFYAILGLVLSLLQYAWVLPVILFFMLGGSR